MRSFISMFIEWKVIIYVWSLYYGAPPLKLASARRMSRGEPWRHRLNNNNDPFVNNNDPLLLLRLWYHSLSSPHSSKLDYFNGGGVKYKFTRKFIHLFQRFLEWNFAQLLITIITLRLYKQNHEWFFIRESL